MEQYQEAYQLINSCTLMRDVDQLLMLKGKILQAIHLNASSEQAFLKVNPNPPTHTHTFARTTKAPCKSDLRVCQTGIGLICLGIGIHL